MVPRTAPVASPTALPGWVWLAAMVMMAGGVWGASALSATGASATSPGPHLSVAAGGAGNSTVSANTSAGCGNCGSVVNDTPIPIPYSSGASQARLAHSAALTPSGSSGYSGHYWLFGTYTGPSTTTTDVYDSVVLPNIGPRAGDMFYEELSIWDSAGHYDQIGVTSDYNSGGTPSTSTDDWNANWVSAPNCGTTFGTGTWNPDLGSLDPGAAYTFEIALSPGMLSFDIYAGDGTPSGLTLVYSVTVSSTATSLLEQTSTMCGQNLAYGYTVAEEVFNTTVQPFPNWDFNFSNNHASGAYVTSWGEATSCLPALTGSCPVPTSPHGYPVWLKSGWAFVEFANQAFSFQNAPYLSVSTTPGGSFSTLYESDFIVGSYCRTNTCYAAGAYSLPSGWSGSVGFGSLITSSPAVSSVSFTVPTSALTGEYEVWIQLQLTSGPGGSMVEFTSMMVYVDVT